MTIKQALKTSTFQEQDARTAERKHLNEILDKDNRAEKLNII